MTAIAQLDGTIYINNEPDIVDITRANPGQTFVGILPGHNRPAFVRKRRRSGSCFTDFFRPKRTYSSEYIHHTYTESNRYHRPPSPYHTTRIVTDRPVVVASGGSAPSSSHYYRYDNPPARLMKHTCGSCGKFRSNTYCRANPLADGEVPKPSLCRRCVHNKTSSEASDRSYEAYVKNIKRRRRRELREDEDDSYERFRKAEKRRRRSSMDDSYEKYRETRSYRRQGGGYDESESGYSSYEGRNIPRPRVVYLDRSDSRRLTGSSSGGSVISVSVKSERPRRLRRESRGHSSAEEVRVIRSIMRESPRERRRSSPYRYRHRSETRSEGSVRFDLPPRERRRKYRVLNYDGETAPYEEMVRSVSPSRSYSAEVVHENPRKTDHRSSTTKRREHWEPHPTEVDARIERTYRIVSAPERTRRPSTASTYHITASDNGGHTLRERNDDLESLAFMSGSRGRSLSSERRAVRRDESIRREARRRSRSAGRTSSEYSPSSDESSANYVPQRHPSFRRQTPTPVRVSRLMQRLALENSLDGETIPAEPPRRQIEYGYVQPRTSSRGRSPSSQRNDSHRRSPSRESTTRQDTRERSLPRGREIRQEPRRYQSPPREVHSRRAVHERYITNGEEDSARNRYHEYLTERDRPTARGNRVSDGGWDFGGRVRHVRVSDRLG